MSNTHGIDCKCAGHGGCQLGYKSRNKPPPPEPPPMRMVNDSAIDGLFGFMLTVMISISIGIMIGLKIQ